MTPRALLATLATLGVLVTGCGSQTSGQTSGQTSDRTSQRAGDSSPSATPGEGGGEHDAMDMDMGTGDGPSDPAAMICSAEIRDAVKRTFAMSEPPTSTKSWSTSDRLFSCTYRVPRGTLAMSVQDATDEKAGRAYFDKLRGSLDGATPIRGMDAFGFPAFQTSDGNVVFLKDGKTLRVDASSLGAAALPPGYSRPEAAYSVASAVIACWTE